MTQMLSDAFAFAGQAEGRKLLSQLETGITASRRRPNIMPQRGENPLYEFRRGKDGNGYSYPVVQKVFDLMGRNGYGSSFVQKDDEALKNEFRAGLNSRDPSWIQALEMPKFDKLIYFFNFENSKGLNGIHYIPERLVDGTIHAMLDRAMELGRFQKQGPAPTSGPAPSAPRV